MRNMKKLGLITVIMTTLFVVAPAAVSAHCDTLDGPVVSDAKAALEKGDVTPVLKWVQLAQEGEVKAAFNKTLTVRALSPAVQELADTYFFETLVRLHRAGEGAPYTGLKPAGRVEPVVAAADKALESGEVAGLAESLTDDIAAGIHKRFHHAYEAKQHADENVQAGREYVHAYVEFVHYVERLHEDATASAVHGEGQAGHDEHVE